MWDPPRPGLEPVSPALAGRFATAAPPGKPLFLYILVSSIFYSFLCTDISPPWLNLFLNFFFLLVVFVKGIVFLISLSHSSLSVYRNTTDFCVLILYPVTLLNFFTSFFAVFRIIYVCVYIYIYIYIYTHIYMYKISCRLQRETLLLLPFQYGCLLFV